MNKSGIQKSFYAFLVLFAPTAVPRGGHPGLASDQEGRLEDVIENVRRNEEIYSNIEIHLHESYDIGGREPEDFGDGAFEVVRKDIHTRYVAQQQLFRLDIEGTNFGVSGQSEADRIRAFDGSVTRSYSQQAIGNVTKGRKTDTQFIRPHMLLLHFMELGVTLSAYLRGHDAIMAIPGANWSANQRLVTTYGGESTENGLLCHRIVADVYVGNRPVARWELWLAEDRNYIPVRLVGYNLSRDGERPNRYGWVAKWNELAPGVWFPAEVEIDAYAAGSGSRGKALLDWRTRYSIEDVSLNPSHEPAFFSTLDFPTGTAVYEIEDDKIVNRYRVGAPPASGSRVSPIGGWWPIIAFHVLVGTLALGFVMLRSYKRRTGPR